MQGWIKLHRKMTEWEWFQKSEMVHLFVHLLLIANHEPKPWQGIDVKRGQVVTGLKALKKATGISNQTLRTCLSKLEKTGNLTSKSTNKFRVITICNYETYQLKETDTNKQTNKQLTINQQTTNNQLTPNKNVKNEKTVKNEKKTTFPPQLNTPEFNKAWSEWSQHRIEIKKKLTPSTISSQLKMLSGYPINVSISTIERSIQNGWAGLFPDKDNSNDNGKTTQSGKRQSQGKIDFSSQTSKLGVSFSNIPKGADDIDV